MPALNVVSDFTKPKTGNATLSLAERRTINAEGAEGWLRAVLADAPLAIPEGWP
jgi:hypothetical protein